MCGGPSPGGGQSPRPLLGRTDTACPRKHRHRRKSSWLASLSRDACPPCWQETQARAGVPAERQGPRLSVCPVRLQAPRGRDEPSWPHPVAIPEPRKLRASFPEDTVPRRAATAPAGPGGPHGGAGCGGRRALPGAVTRLAHSSRCSGGNYPRITLPELLHVRDSTYASKTSRNGIKTLEHVGSGGLEQESPWDGAARCHGNGCWGLPVLP